MNLTLHPAASMWRPLPLVAPYTSNSKAATGLLVGCCLVKTTNIDLTVTAHSVFSLLTGVLTGSTMLFSSFSASTFLLRNSSNAMASSGAMDGVPMRRLSMHWASCAGVLGMGSSRVGRRGRSCAWDSERCRSTACINSHFIMVSVRTFRVAQVIACQHSYKHMSIRIAKKIRHADT